jgi:hypothetical protein
MVDVLHEEKVHEQELEYLIIIMQRNEMEGVVWFHAYIQFVDLCGHVPK